MAFLASSPALQFSLDPASRRRSVNAVSGFYCQWNVCPTQPVRRLEWHSTLVEAVVFRERQQPPVWRQVSQESCRLLGTATALWADEWHPRGNIPASSPVYGHVSRTIWQGKLLSGTPKRLLTPGRSYFKILLCQNTFSSFPFLPGNNLMQKKKIKIYYLTIFPEEFKWGLS